MLNALKLFFQFLVVIQGLSYLFTGNGKMGTKIAMTIIKILQSSISTMFCVVTYIIKINIKTVRKNSKTRKKNIKKLSNKKCQKEIRAYNKARNTIDIQSYIKDKNTKRKGLR